MLDSFPMAKEIRRPDPIVQRAPIEVLQPVIQPIVSLGVLPTDTVPKDDDLRQNMKQVVYLMKNISLNLLNGVGNGRQGGRQSNQPTNGGGQNGRSWR